MPFCPKCRDEFEDWVKTCPDCNVALVNKLPTLPPPRPASIITSRKLATVATFSHPEEAHFYRAKLESEGIMAFVFDEHIVQANWLYSIAVGGVKLKVRKSDVKKALKILNDTPKYGSKEAAASIKNGEGHCPKCNSADVRHETFNIPPIFLSWFILGFPLPFLKRKWKCRTCGYEWRKKKKRYRWEEE